MIIQNSTVELSSQRIAIEEYQKKESLRYWQTDVSESPRLNEELQPGKNNRSMTISGSSVKVSLSSESIKKSAEKNMETGEDAEILSDLNIRVLRAFIERLTGKKIKFYKFNTSAAEEQKVNGHEPANDLRRVDAPGFGLEYDFHEHYYESELTTFNAAGTIVTADGKEVQFTVDLNMSREFYQENSISIRMGEALKDPLVVNFTGNSAELTDTKFIFDIDADGKNDEISFVSPESGFLTLDRNGDGVVNDGTELFGALTGDGFGDLAQFDDDGNGWIDENDDIYDRLRIWTKDVSGNDQLIALGQKGIGAIYLGNIATPFEVKNNLNEMQGQIKSTSVFLSVDHNVGTVQQLDLVV